MKRREKNNTDWTPSGRRTNHLDRIAEAQHNLLEHSKIPLIDTRWRIFTGVTSAHYYTFIS